MNLKDRTRQLKMDIPAVFLSLKSKETPVLAKVVAGITVAYALSPIDLIPDFIPIFGYLDDVILLPVLITLTIKLIPEEIFERFRKEAEGIWQNEKPKKWYFAIPIVLVWILAVWILVAWILVV